MSKCNNEWCDPEAGNDCQECFRKRAAEFDAAFAASNTPEFKAAEADYAAKQKAADEALAHIVNTWKFENIFWCPMRSGRILPHHRSVLESE